MDVTKLKVVGGKILSWLKSYWYIPVIAVIATILFFSGRDISWFVAMLEKRSEMHKKEIDALEKAREAELKKKAEAEKKFQEAVKKVEEEYEKKIGKIDDDRRKEIIKLVKKSKKDPGSLAELAASKYGLHIVGDDE